MARHGLEEPVSKYLRSDTIEPKFDIPDQPAWLKTPGGDREMVEILAVVLQHDEQAVLAAVELALEAGAPTKTHILNVLHRLVDGKPIDPPAVKPPNALTLISLESRKPTSSATTPCAKSGRRVMRRRRRRHHGSRTLKMHGMAQAVGKLTEQGSPAFEAALPILSQP